MLRVVELGCVGYLYLYGVLLLSGVYFVCHFGLGGIGCQCYVVDSFCVALRNTIVNKS